MDIGDVVGDAIRYPSQDWKKVVIFIIIVIVSMLIGRAGVILGIIGLIISFLVYGYVLRIIKASIAGSDELPEFNEWGNMFIEGIKVFLVNLFYSIPAIIASVLLAASVIATVYFQGMGTVSTGASGLLGLALIGIAFAFLYMLLIGIPLFLIATANMAYYNGEFSAAFRFSEIKDHIYRIGLTDFIIWYIVMIFSFIIAVVVGFVTLVGWILLIPYFYLFLARSLALLFTSDARG
jgi:hypothetical protein